MTLLGTPVPRVEDARLLAVGGTYVADVDLPGALAVTYVTSTEAHARLRAIDVSAARRAPGVVDVVVGSDVDLGPIPPVNAAAPRSMARFLLARDRVRFVGEAIVAILSETPEQGEDAASEVAIEYEPLPVV